MSAIREHAPGALLDRAVFQVHVVAMGRQQRRKQGQETRRGIVFDVQRCRNVPIAVHTDLQPADPTEVARLFRSYQLGEHGQRVADVFHRIVAVRLGAAFFGPGL